jgi:hypothetical protein
MVEVRIYLLVGGMWMDVINVNGNGEDIRDKIGPYFVSLIIVVSCYEFGPHINR